MGSTAEAAPVLFAQGCAHARPQTGARGVPRQRETYGFDVLELPAAAGLAVLGRRLRTGPVALAGRRMRFLIAAESAAELPGLLCWLEWGDIPLDLDARRPVPGEFAGAVWLRPPTPEALGRLPALTLTQGGGRGPGKPVGAGGPGGAEPADLVRLVSAAATACHRLRLFHPGLSAPAGATGPPGGAREPEMP
ncbi:hypothetical protein AB0M28_39275 [Streptomyces sp. NPDC051940]|uniref:hypothetical protein n=1 Tax=Streptomyces sp. NPDC051940 TaxID=3155675 RepID=UPI00343CC0D7